MLMHVYTHMYMHTHPCTSSVHMHTYPYCLTHTFSLVTHTGGGSLPGSPYYSFKMKGPENSTAKYREGFYLPFAFLKNNFSMSWTQLSVIEHFSFSSLVREAGGESVPID